MKNKRLKSTYFFKPYDGDIYNLKSTGCGVYLIKKNNIIVYVGMASKDIQRTMYRHFQKWTDKRSNYTKKMSALDRVTFKDENRNNFLVKVIYCPSVKEAEILEQYFIKKFKPALNKLKIERYEEIEYRTMQEKLENDIHISAQDEEPPF